MNFFKKLFGRKERKTSSAQDTPSVEQMQERLHNPRLENEKQSNYSPIKWNVTPPTNDDNRRSEPRKVWVMSDGSIDCPGDSCPKACDETCPIYCNTLALPHFRARNFGEVERLLKKAISLEPRMEDSWSTLGTCHGIAGRHEDAYKCFKKAYDLGRRNAIVLNGLLTACQNTKRYEEGLTYCDDLESHDMDLANSFRHLFLEKMAQSGLASSSSNVEFLMHERLGRAWPEVVMELRTHGAKCGFEIKATGYITIPEVSSQADAVCHEILRGLMELDLEHYRTELPAMWALFAGAGTVALWQNDWQPARLKGLSNALLSQKGLNNLDEWVIFDVWGFTEKDLMDIHENAAQLSKICLDSLIKPVEDIVYKNKDSHMMLINAWMHVMFIYGMQYQMDKYGMR